MFLGFFTPFPFHDHPDDGLGHGGAQMNPAVFPVEPQSILFAELRIGKKASAQTPQNGIGVG